MGNSGLLSALSSDKIVSVSRRDQHLFALYRTLVAAVITALAFGPLTPFLSQSRHPRLAGIVALVYLTVALVLWLCGRNKRWLTPVTLLGITADIIAATLTIHAQPDAAAGISMMLLFNIAVAATMLPLKYGLCIAAAAGIAGTIEYLWAQLDGGTPKNSLAELIMFATSYFATTYVCQHVGKRARRNQILAEKRGAAVANLSEINQLIIRRMRTGVLVVDNDNRITLANEAAIALLGEHKDVTQLELGNIPQLLEPLQQWRKDCKQEHPPIRLSPQCPEVQPRFARLLVNSGLTLIFLDDTSVISRRAELLTLSTMGRFSASLAHEIRNPLTAISYAAQLLEESPDTRAADQHLLQIIHQQCRRANGIIESVLSLARRERANVENIELADFVHRYALEYRQTMPIDRDFLETSSEQAKVFALIDPQHLHQILTALVNNAFKYGRTPGQPAQVQLCVSTDKRNAIIEVRDHGPGITDTALPQLFTPFFTTSDHGTGLGLYIAQELCRANQAHLEYRALPSCGACFQLLMALPPTSLS